MNQDLLDQLDRDEALRQLMSEYGQDIWNFAYSLIRNREVADDVTQDVFLKAFQKLNTFGGQSSLKSWLLAITKNTTRDYWKSAFFRRVTLVDDFQQSIQTHPSAEDEAIMEMETENLWKQVFELPLKFREVLVLYGHNQLSIEEISQVLHLNPATVKTRLHRARKKLIDKGGASA